MTASAARGAAPPLARRLRRVAEHARERGVILADTKFEFGLDARRDLVLGDEVLTPDSSRFWPADELRAGLGPALVRQAVRARLGPARVDKPPPAPALPDDVVAGTRERYVSRLRAARGRAVLGLAGAVGRPG